MTIRKLLAGAILAVALAVTGVAVATGAAGSPPPPPAAGPGVFAVFRRPATDADRMPAATRAELAGPVARHVAQADFDDVRAVAQTPAGAVWAIPAPADVCLAQPDPVDGFALACAPIDTAAEGQLWVGLDGMAGQSAGDVRVAMFVPDGVPSVTAIAADGTQRSVAVADNVAFARLSDSQSIRFDAGNDQATIAVPGTPPALVAP